MAAELIGQAKVMTAETFVFPTSFAQERLWFLDQLVPNNAFYNLESSLRLYRAVDHAVLSRSLNEIVRRHETLRTTFQVIDGSQVQVVTSSLQMEVPLVDLSSLTNVERDRKVVRFRSSDSRYLGASGRRGICLPAYDASHHRRRLVHGRAFPGTI